MRFRLDQGPGSKSAAAPATVSGEPLVRLFLMGNEPLNLVRVWEGGAGGVDSRARRPAVVVLTKASGRGAPEAGEDHACHNKRPLRPYGRNSLPFLRLHE